jgi:hypothetical protein
MPRPRARPFPTCLISVDQTIPSGAARAVSEFSPLCPRTHCNVPSRAHSARTRLVPNIGPFRTLRPLQARWGRRSQQRKIRTPARELPFLDDTARPIVFASGGRAAPRLEWSRAIDGAVRRRDDDFDRRNGGPWAGADRRSSGGFLSLRWAEGGCRNWTPATGATLRMQRLKFGHRTRRQGAVPKAEARSSLPGPGSSLPPRWPLPQMAIHPITCPTHDSPGPPTTRWDAFLSTEPH